MNRLVLDIVSLARIAERQWGLVTTGQHVDAGVPEEVINDLREAGYLVDTYVDDVWRVAGAVEHRHEMMLATWLAAGGPSRGREHPLVVAGSTAAVVHGIGDYMEGFYDFASSDPPDIDYLGLEVRHLQLTSAEVTSADGLPVLTPARTIADLVENYGDLSIVAGALNDAAWKHYLVRPRDLDHLLAPLASTSGFGSGDGAALRRHLYTLAGIAEDGFPVRPGHLEGHRDWEHVRAEAVAAGRVSEDRVAEARDELLGSLERSAEDGTGSEADHGQQDPPQRDDRR